MDITTQRRAMNAVAIGLIVAAVGVAYWSMSELGESLASNDRREITTPLTNADAELVLITKDPISMRTLRGPLYDAPEPPQPVVSPPPSKPVVPKQPVVSQLDLKLVGTIIDDQQSVAIVTDASGSFDVKSSGETLELIPPGVTIQSIEAEQITLNYQGRESTIQLDRSGSAVPASMPTRPNARGRNR